MTNHHSCTIRELVDGKIQIPSDELTPSLTDPDSGESIHHQLSSASETVEKAIATAWTAHTDSTWTGLPPKERAAALRTLQSELASRAEELGRADSLDSGVPVTTTVAFAGALTAMLSLAADRIEKRFDYEEQTSSAGACDQWRLPWGPAAIFLPWNAPTATALTKTADALAAGCPVIIKPSEWAPHFSGPFADAVRASLPDGVVQILHGGRSVGEAIVGDERISAVSYTGGVTGGTAVAEACARQLKPVDLELSGNNPVVVLRDADPQVVVANVVAGMLLLNGQFCSGPRRLVVPEDQLEDYVAALASALEPLIIGATAEPTSQLGPLSHEPHRRHIEDQLTELAARGCEVYRYGRLPDLPGHFVSPAVVLSDDAPEFKEEIFGPVILLRTYRDIDEAVAIANDHPYGLSGHVFSGDRDTARSVGRRLRAGIVKVNWVLAGPPDITAAASMWGASGLGGFGLDEGPKFFSGSRFVG